MIIKGERILLGTLVEYLEPQSKDRPRKMPRALNFEQHP